MREAWECWHRLTGDCSACTWLKKMGQEEYDAIWLDVDRQLTDHSQGDGDEEDD